jgi:hypothetical protein
MIGTAIKGTAFFGQFPLVLQQIYNQTRYDGGNVENTHNRKILLDVAV